MECTIKEVKGSERKSIIDILTTIEAERDKSNDYKVKAFYWDLVSEVKGKAAQCYGNESIRCEGKYNDSCPLTLSTSVNVSYFEEGMGHGPWIGLTLALGDVYHADVRNRAHYATEKLISCSIGIEDDPLSQIGSAIRNKTKMKKNELAARFDGYYQVTSPKNLLKYAYLYLKVSENKYGKEFIDKCNKEKGYNKMIRGW